jgi:general secretion pathway protein J
MIPRILADKRGLTLLELVISFSILTLILVIVLGALRLSFRFWERGEEISSEAQEQRMIWTSLRHQLCSLYPYVVRTANKRYLIFKGGKDEMEFVSLFSPYLQDKGGLRYCRYKIEEDKQGEGFLLKVFETRAVNAELRQVDVGDEQFRVLAEGLPRCRFEYAGRKAGDEPAQWTSEWEGGESRGLPAKIRILFEEPYKHIEELLFPIRAKGYVLGS